MVLRGEVSWLNEKVKMLKTSSSSCSQLSRGQGHHMLYLLSDVDVQLNRVHHYWFVLVIGMLGVQLQINHESFTKRTQHFVRVRNTRINLVLLVNDEWFICNCTPNMPITNTNFAQKRSENEISYYNLDSWSWSQLAENFVFHHGVSWAEGVLIDKKPRSVAINASTTGTWNKGSESE